MSDKNKCARCGDEALYQAYGELLAVRIEEKKGSKK